MDKIIAPIKRLFSKYRVMIMYLIFGVLTTAVNYSVYYALSRLSEWGSTIIPTAAAWIAAVVFAYITNRKWVFTSTAKGLIPVAGEFAAFTGARAASGALDIILMYTLVDIAGFNDMLIKILSNIIVIILNYILSKLIVFKAK